MRTICNKFILSALTLVHALVISGVLHAGEKYFTNDLWHDSSPRLVTEEHAVSALCGFSNAYRGHPEFKNNCGVASDGGWIVQVRTAALGMNQFPKKESSFGSDFYTEHKMALIKNLTDKLTAINFRLNLISDSALRVDDHTPILVKKDQDRSEYLNDFIQLSKVWNSEEGDDAKRLPPLELSSEYEIYISFVCYGVDHEGTVSHNMFCGDNPSPVMPEDTETLADLVEQVPVLRVHIPAEHVQAFVELQMQELAELMVDAHKIEDRDFERQLTQVIKNIILVKPFARKNYQTALIFMNLVREAMNMPQLDLSLVDDNLYERNVEDFVNNIETFVWKAPEPVVKKGASVKPTVSQTAVVVEETPNVVEEAKKVVEETIVPKAEAEQATEPKPELEAPTSEAATETTTVESSTRPVIEPSVTTTASPSATALSTALSTTRPTPEVDDSVSVRESASKPVNKPSPKAKKPEQGGLFGKIYSKVANML